MPHPASEPISPRDYKLARPYTTTTRPSSSSFHNPVNLFYSSPQHYVAMSNFQLPAGMRPASGPSGGTSPGGNGPSPEERAAAEERASQQAEMKRSMIAAMLEPAARERRESEREAAGSVPSSEDLVGDWRLRRTNR